MIGSTYLELTRGYLKVFWNEENDIKSTLMKMLVTGEETTILSYKTH